MAHQDRAAGRPVRQEPDQTSGQNTPPLIESAEPELIAQGWNWVEPDKPNEHLKIDHDPQPTEENKAPETEKAPEAQEVTPTPSPSQ